MRRIDPRKLRAMRQVLNWLNCEEAKPEEKARDIDHAYCKIDGREG